MSVTNDPTTTVGRMRTLAQDPSGEFFSDEELEGFLTGNTGSVRLAAADALDAIAVNQVLLLKKISISGISLDGPAMGKALHDGAMALRAQELGMYDPSGMFDIAETGWDENAYRNVWWNDLLRNEALG